MNKRMGKDSRDSRRNHIHMDRKAMAPDMATPRNQGHHFLTDKITMALQLLLRLVLGLGLAPLTVLLILLNINISNSNSRLLIKCMAQLLVLVWVVVKCKNGVALGITSLHLQQRAFHSDHKARDKVKGKVMVMVKGAVKHPLHAHTLRTFSLK